MRTNWTMLKAVFLGLLCLAVFTTTAQANRRVSLADNLLIEDKEDVYLFPQRLLDYRNSLSLDLGTNRSSGRALFLAGWDDLGLGLSAEQTAPYYIIAGPVPPDLIGYETTSFYAGSLINPFPVTSMSETFIAVPPFTLIDGFLAIPVGDGAFGLRAGFGTRGVSSTVSDVDSGLGETLISLEAGMSGGTDARYDASLNLALDLGSGENGTVNVVWLPAPVDFQDVSSTLIRASLSARGYLPYADRIDVGLLGNLVFTTGSITPQLPEPPVDTGEEFTASVMGFGVMGGAGPVFYPTENTEIGAYGVLGLSFVSFDPDDETDDDGASEIVVYIPGVRLAADIGITNWFFVRAGLQYAFEVASTSYENDDSSSRGDGRLSWSAGLGVEHEGFTLDGALSHDWITEGPDFIGGDPSALFGVVSGGYHWL